MLIVLGTEDDYSPSHLVSFKDFKQISEPLRKLCAQSEEMSKGCVSVDRLKSLAFLDLNEDVPELISIPLDFVLGESFKQEAESSSVEGGKTRHATGKASAKKPTNHSTASGNITKNCWIKAYDSFLRIITQRPSCGLPEDDPKAAIPQIEAIVKLAQKYNAIDKVKNTFNALFLGYVQDRSLWPAIAGTLVKCINISIALESRLIFDEAFKHLVGKSANYEVPIEYPGLPEKVQTLVSQRSREIYHSRMRVEKALLLLTLSAEEPKPDDKSKKSKAAAKPICVGRYVSQQDRQDEYNTVNIFRDWMSEHISDLTETPTNLPKFKGVCDHANGCNSVGGFLHVVANSGNAYLNPKVVCQEWSEDFVYDEIFDEDKVAVTLETLKSQASLLAAPLVASELQLDSKNELEYLTPVKVGLNDVPWVVKPKDKDEVDDDDEGDDEGEDEDEEMDEK